jgi:hypothetical protein
MAFVGMAGGMPGGRGMFGGGRAFEQVAALLDGGQTSDLRLPLQDVPGVSTLPVVGKVPSVLAVAMESSSTHFLATTRDGLLRRFAIDTWKEVRTWRLDQPAYSLLLEEKRRLLFAASSSPSALRLGELGDRNQATGDLLVYELDSILNSEGNLVAPIHRLPFAAHLTGMIFSPTSDHLYYLAESADKVRVGRLDLETWKADLFVDLIVQRPSAMTLSPDGTTLYALAGSRLHSVDTQSWKVTDQVFLQGSVQSLLATGGGRVYVLERGRGVQLKLVDVPTRTILARWTTDAEGQPYFGLSPDRTRVYLGTSAFMTGRIWVVDVSSERMQTMPVVGQAGGDRDRLLRGGLFVLADGRYLITGTGHIYRVES